MYTMKTVAATDDLQTLVNEINAAAWDADNALPRFDATSLRAYLSRQDTIFLSCHETLPSGQVLLGIASSRIEMKPYDEQLWLYVDEVDVCSNHRQRGVGRAIMQKLISIAHEHQCEELWLGTEIDNLPANALYRSLKPDDVQEVIGYTFETDE